jgi:hypothetical protein
MAVQTQMSNLKSRIAILSRELEQEKKRATQVFGKLQVHSKAGLSGTTCTA